MKQKWSPGELIELWELTPTDLEIVSNTSIRWRLAFALQLKHLEIEGHFAPEGRAFAPVVVDYVGDQLEVDARGNLDPRLR